MKKILNTVILLLLPVLFWAKPVILDIPPVAQSRTVPNLCGPTCAQMLLQYYGFSQDQYDVGKALTEMILPYKTNNPGASDALEFSWPDFKETYQPILRLYFEGLGMETLNKRSAIDPDTGLITEERWQFFLKTLQDGLPVIFHIPGHYMLMVGYDLEAERLYYNDPSDGKQHWVSITDFRDRNAVWYKDRLGWDGRMLSAWTPKIQNDEREAQR